MIQNNPYSSERPASPIVFRGYGEKPLFGDSLPGTWNLEEITSCLQRLTGVAPSFWVVGERKLGKTSFLLKIENHLLAQAMRSGGHQDVVPIYLTCKDHRSLLSFYRGILERARTIIKTLSIDDLYIAQTGEDENLDDNDLIDLLTQDLASLVDQFPRSFGRTPRFVLLIDDAEVAVERGWGASLFPHLRSLLTRPPCIPGHHDLEPESLSMVLSACRALQGDPVFASLTDVLEEVPLRPLIASEVGSLITNSPRSALEPHWVDRIYSATAGHPWLVQFIMEQFISFCQGDPNDLDRQFGTIITSRFQKEPARSQICRQWLDGLPEEGIKVLAHLALNHSGETARDLVQRTGLAASTITNHLQQMAELGIVFKPTLQRGDRYALGEIFKDWFLEHTGGKVFLKEITTLKQQAAGLEARAASSGRTFNLLASIDPDVLLADGLYGRRVELENLQDAARDLEWLSRQAKDKRGLNMIVQRLSAGLKQRDWEDVWNDYLRQMETESEQSAFVFRFSDEKLLELPIEMLQLNGDFLGLTAPVYKELFGADREPAYRLLRGHFPTDRPLNVLLVASSSGGVSEGRRYSPLPRAEDEIAEIAGILTGATTETGPAIGKIVALTDGMAKLPEQVEKHPSSAATFEKALRGDLGTQFHLLHYSGHYVHDDGDGDEGAGLLFRGDGELAFFNLLRLRNTLDRRKLRLAFFNACKSGQYKNMNTGYHLGIAHTTLKCGVPVVIGMRWIIGDDEAYSLSRPFYQELVKSGRPEVALWKARRQVYAEEGEGSILWAAPVMLTR